MTNVAADHLGLKGINTIEQLARVKAIVPETVARDGYAVLNADDELVIKFRNSGKWRDMKWKQLKHDLSDEKPRGGWVEFKYVIDLAPGTQENYFIIK